MKKKLLLIILVLITSLLYSQKKELFDQKEIRNHLNYLASDELEGRNTPSKGLDAAADYIAQEYKKYGLKPIGDDGTYFQNFKLFCKKLPTHYLKYEGKTYDKSFEILPPIFDNLETDYKQVKGQIVFAGYGITEPGVSYDDYENIDVKNKIVMFMRGIPNQDDKNGTFNKKEYSKWKFARIKVENAKKHGAIGVLIAGDMVFNNVDMMKYAFILRPYHSASVDSIKRKNGSGIIIAGISEKTADAVLNSSGKTIPSLKSEIDKNNKPSSFPLSSAEAIIEFEQEFTKENTKNVIGFIEGTDPNLKNEVIVMGAHYDHVGIIDNAVYNGADDDASGTTGVMELAKAFSKNKPKRSLLFIAFTGEEQGLVGSQYFVSHPVISLDKIKTMIQLDMIGRDEDTKDPEGALITNLMGANGKSYSKEESKNAVMVMGLSYSKELKNIVTEANSDINLELRTDADSSTLFMASDHYPFYSKNIPVCMLCTGDTPYLHRSTDDVETLNYDKMERILELVYKSVKELADGLSKVTLNKK
jgi:hypothetical protein